MTGVGLLAPPGRGQVQAVGQHTNTQQQRGGGEQQRPGSSMQQRPQRAGGMPEIDANPADVSMEQAIEVFNNTLQQFVTLLSKNKVRHYFQPHLLIWKCELFEPILMCLVLYLRMLRWTRPP